METPNLYLFILLWRVGLEHFNLNFFYFIVLLYHHWLFPSLLLCELHAAQWAWDLYFLNLQICLVIGIWTLFGSGASSNLISGGTIVAAIDLLKDRGVENKQIKVVNYIIDTILWSLTFFCLHYWKKKHKRSRFNHTWLRIYFDVCALERLHLSFFATCIW